MKNTSYLTVQLTDLFDILILPIFFSHRFFLWPFRHEYHDGTILCHNGTKSSQDDWHSYHWIWQHSILVITKFIFSVYEIMHRPCVQPFNSRTGLVQVGKIHRDHANTISRDAYSPAQVKVGYKAGSRDVCLPVKTWWILNTSNHM